jgi:hypothetical protein
VKPPVSKAVLPRAPPKEAVDQEIKTSDETRSRTISPSSSPYPGEWDYNELCWKCRRVIPAEKMVRCCQSECIERAHVSCLNQSSTYLCKRHMVLPSTAMLLASKAQFSIPKTPSRKTNGDYSVDEMNDELPDYSLLDQDSEEYSTLRIVKRPKPAEDEVRPLNTNQHPSRLVKRRPIKPHYNELMLEQHILKKKVISKKPTGKVIEIKKFHPKHLKGLLPKKTRLKHVQSAESRTSKDTNPIIDFIIRNYLTPGQAVDWNKISKLFSQAETGSFNLCMNSLLSHDPTDYLSQE